MMKREPIKKKRQNKRRLGRPNLTPDDIEGKDVLSINVRFTGEAKDFIAHMIRSTPYATTAPGVLSYLVRQAMDDAGFKDTHG